MTFQVIHQPDAGDARSPFHVVEQPAGREVEWVNCFLDREWVRRLAQTTLRSAMPWTCCTSCAGGPV